MAAKKRQRNLEREKKQTNISLYSPERIRRLNHAQACHIAHRFGLLDPRPLQWVPASGLSLNKRPN